ncbi:uncharacterized protein LOC127251312 [Andrographis paniculata]|uniref:uncharacterized protein LOC127251312 n=1 Tax=Andrographis paniculata TaxID=175694 RepID=UPI0021E8D68C|nr:uncharacterized protein LOC127251312 [Andrographis paniculata]
MCSNRPKLEITEITARDLRREMLHHGARTPNKRMPRKRDNIARYSYRTACALTSIMWHRFCDGELTSSSISLEIWDQVSAQLLAETGQMYSVKQLKGKWNRLKAEWMVLQDLLQKKTGLGVDPETGMVDASTQLWKEWIQAYPAYAHLRTRPFPNYHLCSKMFASDTEAKEHALSYIQQRSREAEPSGADVPSGPDDSPMGLGVEGGGPGTGAEAGNNPPPPVTWARGPATRSGRRNRWTVQQERLDEEASTVQPSHESISHEQNERFRVEEASLDRTIEALESIPDIPDEMLFRAHDKLVSHSRRRLFLSLSAERRRNWVLSLLDK